MTRKTVIRPLLYALLLFTCYGNETGSLHEADAIHATIARRHASLLALITLRPQQIARELVLVNLVRLLVPQAGAVDAELADDAALLHVAVAQDQVVHRRRRDELHQDVRVPVRLRYRLEVRRDGAAVDVVAAALALRLEHVALSLRGVQRLLARLEARR